MINYLPKQKNQLPKISSARKKQQIVFATIDDNQTNTQSSHWQSLLTELIDDVDELLSLLNLTHIKDTLYLPANFGLRVPRGFVAKMEKGNPNDPLLRQVLPDKREQVTLPNYVTDPLAENSHNPVKGLLHKYRSRVLLTVTGACAIHCRYCFRQHFDYQANLPNTKELEDIQRYIGEDPTIEEVILSGGDPLNVSNRRLFMWLDMIESLPQITTIRLHTRLPIVIPERLDTELLSRLSSSRCHIVMVIHTNHANEIDNHTATFLQQAKMANITLLNQTVLLTGINDDLDTQVALNKRLFAVGVLPYYLHLLDKVDGAAHFDMSKSQALSLYWQILEALPGYLVPRLVEELPNRPFKTPVNLYD